jgi:hypothetical protein
MTGAAALGSINQNCAPDVCVDPPNSRKKSPAEAGLSVGGNAHD